GEEATAVHGSLRGHSAFIDGQVEIACLGAMATALRGHATLREPRTMPTQSRGHGTQIGALCQADLQGVATRVWRSRSELATLASELRLMAALAITGVRKPNAARGTLRML